MLNKFAVHEFVEICEPTDRIQQSKCLFMFFLILYFRYIKAALLPMQPPINHMCWTKPVIDLQRPTFGETFPIAVPLNKLYTKTLQVNVWCTGNEHEECLVRVQNFSSNLIIISSSYSILYVSL